jgi:hypothetical protein
MLGLFVVEYFTINDKLAPASPALLETFYRTVEEVFGRSSAAKQRRMAEPKREAPELPKEPLKPLVLPKVSKAPTVKEIIGSYTMIVMSSHGIGNIRKMDSTEVLAKDEEEADADWIGANKKLMESDELRDINYTKASCRSFIESRSMPSLVKDGIYILNRASVDECIERIRQDNEKVRQQAALLAEAWPRLLTEAKKRLKKRFNAGDYLKPEEVRSRFSIDYQLIEIKPPEPEKMSDKVFREEKAKWEKLWADAAANADQLLTAGMIEQINLMMERLAPREDGKAKQIRETCLDSINDFLGTFNPRNMQNNQQLKVAADRAREIIKGVSPDTLRESKNAREYVSKGFAQIKKALEPMVQDKPSRAIDLE